MAKIRELVTKWKGLGKGLEQNRDGLTDILWTEIFSKVDPKAYGLK